MAASDQSMLICDAGPVRFALALVDMVEILPVVPLWRPPTMPRPLVGFALVRGETVAVLSAGWLLGGDGEDDAVDLSAHLVRVRDGGGGSACLLVDRAAAIVTHAAVRPLNPSASHAACAVGLVAVADGEVPVVSVARLLADGTAARVAALTAEAARRAAAWEA